MARNLTEQVRGIARVVTAVAKATRAGAAAGGAGRDRTLVSTINDMIDTLRTFADQSPAWPGRLVEGQLAAGRRARRRRRLAHLTNNVNELAGN